MPIIRGLHSKEVCQIDIPSVLWPVFFQAVVGDSTVKGQETLDDVQIAAHCRRQNTYTYTYDQALERYVYC